MPELILCILLLAFVVIPLAYSIGKQQGHLDCRSDSECVDRYRSAVDDLDKWCGHESNQARLIARHIESIGEGYRLNSGTPQSDEPCTVSGLREQLRRITSK